jgi:hypothetical protein
MNLPTVMATKVRHEVTEAAGVASFPAGGSRGADEIWLRGPREPAYARGMDPGTDYAAAWREYGRRRGTFQVVGGGGVAALVMYKLLATDRPFTRHAAIGAFELLCFVWLAAAIVTGLRWAAFRCPRCGQVFAAFTETRWPYRRYPRRLAGRCGHCALGIGEDRTDDPRAAS